MKRVDPDNAAGLARLLDCDLKDLVAGDGEVYATAEDQRHAAELLEHGDLIRHLSPSDSWELAEGLIRSSMLPDLPLQRLGRLYNLLSTTVWRQGRYDQAAELAQHARTIAARINDRAIDHKASYNIATIESIRGRLHSAMRTLARCVEQPEHFESDRDFGLALANLAATGLDLAEFDQEMKYHHMALAVFERLDLSYNQSISWLNIGIEHAELGRVAKAEAACRASIRLADAASYPRGRFTGQAYLAGVRALAGDTNEARSLIRESMDGLASFKVYAVGVHEVEARVARLAGDLDEAEAAMDRALPLVNDFPVQLGALHMERARLANARGMPEEEARHRRQANKVYAAADIPNRCRHEPVVEYGRMFQVT